MAAVELAPAGVGSVAALLVAAVVVSVGVALVAVWWARRWPVVGLDLVSVVAVVALAVGRVAGRRRVLVEPGRVRALAVGRVGVWLAG